MMKRIVKIALACTTVACINAGAQSPYIATVYDFRPAPGQLVNTAPEYRAGDTAADMIRKAGQEIAGNAGGIVSLGGYGGYIVFGFDHPVRNVKGRYDFQVMGNAFGAAGGGAGEGGSAEPGIVMVAMDDNGNGLPDDQWYELAGSEYRKPETVHNYRITYTRPDESKPRTPDPASAFISDMNYIRWTTNGYGDGYMQRNIFHSQPYYPQWLEEDELTFSGARLAGNGVDVGGTGGNYVLYALPWGYADNHSNSDSRSFFNIEWAVDGEGNPVYLPHVDFVKVYTAVNQSCGWIGETSTEVAGAEDLHMTGRDEEAPPHGTAWVDRTDGSGRAVFFSNGSLRLRGLDGYVCRIMTINGKDIEMLKVNGENVDIPLRTGAGLYILNARKGKDVVSFKFVIKFAATS